MSDPLSATARLRTLDLLSNKLLWSLRKLNDGSPVYTGLLSEISHTKEILRALNKITKEEAVPSLARIATLGSLEDLNGPISLLTAEFQRLDATLFKRLDATIFERLHSETGIQEAKTSSGSTFKRNESEKVLEIIKFQKYSLSLILETDQIASSQEFTLINVDEIGASQSDFPALPPLYLAARRNDSDMVKRLLELGANVESKDGSYQTPLWWAVHRNVLAVVKLLFKAGADIEAKDSEALAQSLLDAGANIEAKDRRGQTPLLWAARTRNSVLAQSLLDAGANIEAKDGEGQTPLLWAAWNSNLVLIKLLLEAGASVEAKDHNGHTPLWWALRRDKSVIIKLFRDAEADLKSRDKSRSDAAVVSKLPLDSYSDKRPLEAGVDVAMNDAPQLSTSSTQPVAPNKTNLPKHFDRAADPNTLRNAVKRFDLHSVQDLLTQDFTLIARDDFHWLNELVEMGYDYQDIAKLLVDEKKESPWILIQPTERSNSTIPTDFHQAFCVHQGGNRLTFSPKLVAVDEGIGGVAQYPNCDLPGSYSIKQQVAASCGLAGVIPVSRKRQEWIGSVAFEVVDSAVASVTYELEPSDTMSTIDDYLLRVEEALERLVSIVLWLQQNQLCCDSFTTLKLSIEVGRVEAMPVPFSLISSLVDMVSILRSSERKREILNSAWKVAQGILDLIYGVERDGATPFNLDALDLKGAERTTVHNCALATQSLCLGLLSYSNAHASPIQPFFLSRALKRVNLLGIGMHEPDQQCLSVELVELTCFGQMIGNSVIVFTCKKLVTSRKYDLLASPEDLVDTWGPGRFVIDRLSTTVERLCAIEIGGGTIRPTVEDATLFHRDRSHVKYEALGTRFDSRSKIIIAATEINVSCPLDQSQSWQSCMTRMENLGTSHDHWRVSEIQAGSQAGQYIMLQFNRTWVKQDGITLKDRQLNAAPGTIYLPFLESFWGLQVSICTGVARRVLIREMLADVMVAYVENRLPVSTLWESLLIKHDVISHFRGPNLEIWFHTLSPELQTLVVQIVRYILGILGDTGYDRQNDQFVIAWPFFTDPFRCFRISCKQDQHLWTRVLADSETCATFAYITPNCLEETNGHKCQQSSIARWRNRAVSVDTAVCQYKFCEETPDQAVTWILKPGISCWIGKPGSDLTAKVLRATAPLETRLSITRSSIPEKFRRRISSLQGIPMHRIREKQQSLEANATQVLILTAQKSDS